MIESKQAYYSRVYQYGKIFRVVAFKSGVMRSSLGGGATQQADGVRSSSEGRAPEHIIRAKSRLRELSLCNSWDYFTTITVNQVNQNREDLGLLKKRWNQCLKDYSKKFGYRPRYVMVPELHADGVSWHMHGLLFGVSPQSLEKNENGYLDIPYFRKRFGFVSLSEIKDPVRCSSYIVKYISKNAGEGFREGEHMFFSSKGLQGKSLVGEAVLALPWQWENDFVAIFESSDIERILERGEDGERQRQIYSVLYGDGRCDF